jgi:hypothetical protein
MWGLFALGKANSRRSTRNRDCSFPPPPKTGHQNASPSRNFIENFHSFRPFPEQTFQKDIERQNNLYLTKTLILVMAALYTLQGSQVLVCMCGLPARGKTYIAQKGILDFCFGMGLMDSLPLLDMA